MNETKASVKFEQRIARIYELVKDRDSLVTWNDKIPDPDNPQQSRQIDITIKIKDKLTLVECRHHEKKQDVKWIEELIGRRSSLNADLLIAVSNLGFTKGAILKANKFGIILRDLGELTEQEVKTWGKLIPITLEFIEFKCVEIHFISNSDKDFTLDENEIKTELGESNDHIGILTKVITELEKNDNFISEGEFQVTIFHSGPPIFGHDMNKIRIKGKAKRIRQHLKFPGVTVYGHPDEVIPNREIKIQHLGLGDSEIIHTPKGVGVYLDLGGVKAPPGSMFRHITYKAASNELKSMGVKLLRSNINHLINLNEIKVRVTVSKQNYLRLY